MLCDRAGCLAKLQSVWASVQVLATDFSAAASAAVMNRLAKLSARFIGERGFSIGVDDVTPAEALQRRKRAIIAQSYTQCEARSAGPCVR